LAELLAAKFAQTTSALISVTGFQLGALTFLGLGDRVYQNAAAGLLEQLAYVLGPERMARESREIAFAELPTVDANGCEIGGDRDRRTALVVSLVAACGCRDIKERILRTRSN